MNWEVENLANEINALICGIPLAHRKWFAEYHLSKLSEV